MNANRVIRIYKALMLNHEHENLSALSGLLVEGMPKPYDTCVHDFEDMCAIIERGTDEGDRKILKYYFTYTNQAYPISNPLRYSFKGFDPAFLG